MKVSRKLPEAIDLTILEFLEHGDKELIAKQDREKGHKTHRNYVVAVLKGRYRNARILTAAFELALQRKARFPLQAIKQQSA